MNITIDVASPVPPYEQLRAGIAALIRSGALPPGTPLPSVRQLARDLGLAPGTVQHGYVALREAGLVVSRSRRHVEVAPVAAVADARRAPGALEAAVSDIVAAARAAGLTDAELRALLDRALEAADH
ncbi:MAG TPA: GntR family transcriptional regulator [Actinomycetes bacterium]|nr:GntR family transcriptional regulator [Actinomycetes bacterium]